ncbi:MAG: class I SAM-dependent RNA methyltransferase [Alphaproteobacteria bacterium]|nr:class I SAM-dependent RNA methyltransferase [Alphaproteobacteria bacterium]
MEVLINRLGARGDGISDTADGPVYVPFALPGETVSVRVGKSRGDGRAAELRDVLSPSADRQAAVCRHFGPGENACGGCAAQHLTVGSYADWKRNVVSAALARHRIEIDVLPMISVPPASRRRVRLAFRNLASGLVLGFRSGRSDRIVDIAECPVAMPEIVALILRLRDFLAGRVDRGELAITHTDEGADVVMFSRKEPDLDLRMDAPSFCADAGIARLAWSSDEAASNAEPPEPVIVLETPSVEFGGTTVHLPSDSFLQPTTEGETALRAFVLEAVGDAAVVADLYAGCGAFALPLAEADKTVTAFEGLAAQTDAIRRAGAGLKIAAETRDLARQPLRPAELEGFDAVVLDPPRAGAAAQVELLAAGGVPCIVYVSCNPATFARDARVLIDGGYALDPVQPVDQFLWSSHVELASVFRRA